MIRTDSLLRFLVPALSIAFVLGGCGGKPAIDSASDADIQSAGIGGEDMTGTASTEEPQEGDWIIVHESGEPATLNLYLEAAGASAVQIVQRNIFEQLLERDNETLELVPHIAKSWEISDDHLTYTFYLRDDVRFSDGIPLTAHDVVFTVNAILNPKNDTANLRSYMTDLESVEALDDYTVRFTVSKPYFLNLTVLGNWIVVLPKHIYGIGDFNTHPNNRNPIGSGPFVMEEWKTGSHITLTKRADYWGSTKPHVDKIRYLMVSDTMAAFQVLQAQEIDMMALTSEQWVMHASKPAFEQKFHKLTGYSVAEGYVGSFSWIGWNTRRPQLADKRVRQAFTMLLDRQKIIDTLLYGLARVVTGPDFPDSAEYNKDIEPWPYDPPRAWALLDEAGWIDTDNDGIRDKDGIPLKVEWILPSGSQTYERISTVYKEQMDKAGVDFTIRMMEWATFLESVTKREFDACTMSWVSEAESDQYQIWHSSQIEKGSNYVGFANDEVDRILEEARLEFDREKRAEKYQRFHEILHEEQPYTFLFNGKRKVAIDKRFENVRFYPAGFDMHEWWVPKEKQRYK